MSALISRPGFPTSLVARQLSKTLVASAVGRNLSTATQEVKARGTIAAFAAFESNSSIHLYNAGIQEGTTAVFSNALRASSNISTTTKLPEKIENILEQNLIQEDDIEALICDAFQVSAGTDYLAVARFEKDKSESGGLTSEESIKVIFDTKTILPGRLYTDGNHYVQTKQVVGSESELLHHTFSRNDQIFLFDKNTNMEKYKFPGISGHKGPLDKALSFEAAIRIDESGKLLSTGTADQTDKLKTGLAVHQMQVAANFAVILEAIKIHIESGERVTKPMRATIASADEFLSNPFFGLKLPSSANEEARALYRKCEKVYKKFNLTKLLKHFSETIGSAAPKSEVEAKPELDFEQVPSNILMEAAIKFDDLSMEERILEIYESKEETPPMKMPEEMSHTKADSTPFMDRTTEIIKNANDKKGPNPEIDG